MSNMLQPLSVALIDCLPTAHGTSDNYDLNEGELVTAISAMFVVSG